MENVERAKLQAETAKFEAETAKAQVDLEVNRIRAEAERLKLEAEAELARAQTHYTASAAEAQDIALRAQRRAEAEVLAANKYHHVYHYTAEVAPQSVAACMSQLNVWRREGSGAKAPMEIIFTSPGGSVVDGLALFDFLQQLRREGHHITTGTLGMAACVVPETLVLRPNLQWVYADNVRVGDALLAFDEERPPGETRKWRIATVTDASRLRLPCYRLTFDDGTEVTASEDHRWLTGRKGGHALRWSKTRDLKDAQNTRGQSRVLKLAPVVMPDTGREAGWIAGFYDGEGCVTTHPTQRLMVSQKSGPEFDRVIRYLDAFGFDYRINYREGSASRKPISTATIRGGIQETQRFLMSVRPERLIRNFADNVLSRVSVRSTRYSRYPALVSKEFVGEQEVVALATSTGTFIAEGLASHNSMAGILLQAGDTRWMGAEAWVLIHQVQAAMIGSWGTLQDRMRWLERIQARILDIFAARAKEAGDVGTASHPFSRKTLEKEWTRVDFWLSSSDCIQGGIVDEVR